MSSGKSAGGCDRYAVIVDEGALHAAFGRGAKAIKKLLAELQALSVLEPIEIPFEPSVIDPDCEKEIEERPAPVPYNEIVDMYHKICTEFPKLRGLNDKRRRAIAARWREYGENLSAFEEVFSKATKSMFLRGDNARKWTASFDWIICPSNMAKILEGNYDTKASFGGESGFGTDEFFEASLERARRYMAQTDNK